MSQNVVYISNGQSAFEDSIFLVVVSEVVCKHWLDKSVDTAV